VRVTIDRLGHLGDGIASTADGAVFVIGALPGEVVEGELVGDKLTDVRIVTPSIHRVRPPCVHARTCGGCQLQHVSDDFVADWKVQVVRSALEGQGLTATFKPIVTSPPSSRRRATLSARRTKAGVMIGFHARGSDTLVAIPECRLLHPDLMGAFDGLAEIVKIAGSRTSEVSVTVTRSLAGVDVVVTNAKPMDATLRMDLARIVEAHRFARLALGDEAVALRDNPTQRFGRVTVTPPPKAFLQATEEGEAALLAAVRDALGAQTRVIDLFAGLGTFSVPFAATAEVLAVEGDAAMTLALDKAVRQAEGLHRLKVETRDLFRRPLEPDEFKGATGVVLDPPRAGAEAQTERLARSFVPVIAYVSCNPVTFARDAKALVLAGYNLDWVQVVDQFRWSTHVELVGCLRRSK